MTIKESNITINVRDLDKSLAFYTSIGLTIKNRWSNYYAQIEAPGLIIGLHPSADNYLIGNSGNVSIGFTTDNFVQAKEFLKDLFITFTERSEEGGQFIHFEDPDGTALYFIKPNW
jgi:catechol 2,3-dioxygenase-like lactoylglutathione lyase family enzyme